MTREMDRYPDDFDRIWITQEGAGDDTGALWCQDQITEDDVEYVNVRLYDVQAARIAELLKRALEAEQSADGLRQMLKDQGSAAQDRIAELKGCYANLLHDYAEASARADDLKSAYDRAIQDGSSRIAELWAQRNALLKATKTLCDAVAEQSALLAIEGALVVEYRAARAAIARALGER